MALPKRSAAKWPVPFGTRGRALVAATLALAALGPAPIRAQPVGPCLADTSAAAAGELGYKTRGGRCEGALQRYVSSQASIALVGYHRGIIDFGAVRRVATLTLIVDGEGNKGPIALRALSTTGQARYQMDSAEVGLGRPFDWSLELLRKASSLSAATAADLDALGVIACSARCIDRPDTVYWPVALAITSVTGETSALTLKLRAGVRSDSVSMSLRPLVGGGQTRTWPVKNATLTPNGVVTVPLPGDLEPGSYELAVEARDARTREPLGALYATIVVPRPTR